MCGTAVLCKKDTLSGGFPETRGGELDRRAASFALDQANTGELCSQAPEIAELRIGRYNGFERRRTSLRE